MQKASWRHRAGQRCGVQLLEERKKEKKKVPGYLCIETNVSLVAKVASKVPNSPSKNAPAETQLAGTQCKTNSLGTQHQSKSRYDVWKLHLENVQSLVYPEYSIFLTRILRLQQLDTNSPFSQGLPCISISGSSWLSGTC